MDRVGRVLPPDLAAHAHSFAGQPREPVEPRLAATVALVRDGRAGRSTDGPSGIEVYSLRRVATMAFASRMYVFPGGTVDPRDSDPSIAWAGPAPEQWAATLQTPVDRAVALVCAAVRETFEESGVLLAGRSETDVVGDTRGADWEADRVGLVDHTLAFTDVLRRRSLVVRTDLLRAWGRWVTPEFEPRRYDTWFFIAGLPLGQRTRDVGGEADRVVWVRPEDAVAAHEREEMDMLPPTIETFRDLLGATGASDALARAAGRSMTPVMPRPVLTSGGGAYVVLPGEPGYDR